MSEYMGPLRDGGRLDTAAGLIEGIRDKIEAARPIDFDALVSKTECTNMLTVCHCSCRAAIWRKESRGVHTRTDFPDASKEFETNYIHRKS